MDVTRQAVLIFTLVCGPIVLISYIYGVSHSENPSELWGGIPESWWTFIVPFMFIAAAGFIIYWWIVFFKCGNYFITNFFKKNFQQLI